ncbi:hypothetical protein [Halomonas sp. HG01]|uniref:hypothetical protein n=1 Tax=Halomonas sp. HG01 TaxID=1609967 RepID=UPI0006147B53|nr:hypothetical protein [Halomonas sp. HG01]
MCHVEIERRPLHRLHARVGAAPDVVFIVPRHEPLRGVGWDPRRGLFLMLQCGDRCYPLYDVSRDSDILAMRLLAVEVAAPDDPRVKAFVIEALGEALGVAV